MTAQVAPCSCPWGTPRSHETGAECDAIGMEEIDHAIVSDAGLTRRQLLLGAALFAVLPRVSLGLDSIGLMSFEDERKLGRALYKEVLADLTVSTDRKRGATISTILKRVTSVKSIPKGQWDWEIRLIEDVEINAAAFPGGHLILTTAMYDFTRGDVDELATVIGHEVAHVTERHAAKQIRNRAIASKIEGKLKDVLNGSGAVDSAVSSELFSVLEAGTLVGAGLPYGRSQESAADRVGIHYTFDAGYKASDALNLWKRMSSTSSGEKPPAILSSHPSDADRIDRISAELKQLHK